MCLVVLSHRIYPDYPVVLVGHRDEFHSRPTAAMGWWQDRPDVLAGRDLKAGGTWLGVARSGRWAVVTNFRQPGDPPRDAPSRGELVTDFLDSALPVRQAAPRLAARAAAYAGFTLLVSDGVDVACITNRPDTHTQVLGSGTYGLSNARLDDPWPKVVQSRQRVAALLAKGPPDPAGLFGALTDRAQADEADLPDTGLGLAVERSLSPAFIVGNDYGTRSATVLTVDREGTMRIMERRFAAGGVVTGRSAFAFNTIRPG